MDAREIDFMFNDMQTRASAILEFYKDLEKEEKLDRLKVVVRKVEDSVPGGEVYLKDDCIVINVNTGTVGDIVDFAKGIAGKKTSDFWKRALNIDTEELVEAIGFFPDKGNFLYDSNDQTMIISLLMTVFISRFILAHEIGHALDGHCDCGSARFGGTFKFKMFTMESGETVFENADLRSLEQDADSFAICNSVINLTHLRENYEKKVACREYISRDDLFFWWAVAIDTLYHYIDESCETDRQHPSIEARLMNFASVALKFIEERIKLPQGAKQSMCASVARGLDFAEGLNLKEGNRNWIYNPDKKAMDQVDEADAVWKKSLREELLKYAYIPLAM